MILNDLSQKIINQVFSFYAKAINLESPAIPTIEEVKLSIAGDTKRFVYFPPTKSLISAELWLTEDSNKNIFFTFAIPSDLTKTKTEKAEEAKKVFDKELQQFLVDYYI
ncbi:MAG: hypothetical protein WCT08_00980 [Patescibacteria group bacterium]|jgi:hypothetical protein